MKKILLGLGISQLLTLPLVSFVSCGQQCNPQTRTLQNQIDKFNDSITKDSSLTVDQAFNGINNSVTLEDKKINLGKIFDIPILDLGFSISQIIPTIDEQNKTNLNVEITIQKSSSLIEIIKKKISIIGFKPLIKNLNINSIKVTQEKVDQAIMAYNDAKNNFAKLLALKFLFDGEDLIESNLENIIIKAFPTFDKNLRINLFNC